MHKVRTFVYVFLKSLTSINYYRDVIKTPVSFSVKYLLILAIFISLVSAVNVVRDITPKINARVDEVFKSAVETFPENLEISVRDGKLSTNLERPLIIPMPKDSQTEEIENFIVIDTAGTIDDLSKYKTLVLVNENNIISRDEKGLVETRPLQGMPDTTLNRSELNNNADKIKSITRVIPYILFVVMAIALFFYEFVFRLAYLFIPALFLFIVGKSRNLDAKISDYYQIALHTLTLPLVVEVTLAAFGISLPVPFWFFAANLILGLIVVFKLSENNESTGSVAHAESPQV